MNTKQEQRERLKQIRQEAEFYSDGRYDAEKNHRDYKGSPYDEGFLDALDQAVEPAFIAGAKFADNFPRKGLVEIEDVEDIYMAWLRERECFMDYLKGRCIKAGWI